MAEWRNGGNGGTAERMAAQNSRMAEMATYVLFTVYTDDDDDMTKTTLIFYKPRGASPLGQFLLVGPLFLCLEKVRGRK